MAAPVPALADGAGWGGQAWQDAMSLQTVGVVWTGGWNALDVVSTGGTLVAEQRNGGLGGCLIGCGLVFHGLASPLLIVGPSLELGGASRPRHLLGLPRIPMLGLGSMSCEVFGAIAMFGSFSQRPAVAYGAFAAGTTLEISALVFQILEIGAERRLARKTWGPPPEGVDFDAPVTP